MWGQLHRISKKFVTLHRKFDEVTRREINIVKREQKIAETFGRYNIFATLSLSLSQALTYNKISTVSPLAGASIYGFSWIKPREAALFLSRN